MIGRITNIFTLCCVVLATPFLFVGGPVHTSYPYFLAAWNIGHIFYFALLTFWLRQNFFILRVNPNRLKWFIFSLLVLSLGLAIEWAQNGLNRVPDWHDIWRNQLGAWLAWSLLSRQTRVKRPIVCLLGVFLAIELFLVGNAVWTDRRIQNQLPLISELEEEMDLNHWTGNVSLSDEFAARGGASLKVQFDTGHYSGMRLAKMPRDWRGYQWLAFEVFNPEQETLQLTIRINDRIHDQKGHRYSDRFNKRLLVGPGWNHFEISLEDVEEAPSNREMDLKDVFSLGLFATNLKEPRALFFDYFRLH